MDKDGGLPQEEKIAVADRTRCFMCCRLSSPLPASEAGILRKSAFYVEKCSLLIG